MITSSSDPMLHRLRVLFLVLVLPILLAAERSGPAEEAVASAAAEKASAPGNAAPGRTYQELQEPIPAGLDWFHATEREMIDGGVLNDAVHNVKKVAALGRDLSNKVI